MRHTKGGARYSRSPYNTYALKRVKKRLLAALASALLAGLMIAVFALAPGVREHLYDVLGITNIQGGMAGPEDDAVHFIDVGQGDAVLLQSGGEFALVDTGPPEGADNLLAYLRAAGVKRLRYLVMSHPHADHIGAMNEVINAVEVDEMLLPVLDKGPTSTTATFVNILQSLQKKGVKTVEMHAGDVFPLGAATLAVLADGVATEDNLNLICPALLFEMDGVRYLSTGDGEKQDEQAMLDAAVDVHADIFKAGHHGSSTSNTSAFVAAVRPSLVVVTCGRDNDYGHPHRDAMQSFESVGARVLRTDLDGTVVVRATSDGRYEYATAAQANTYVPEEEQPMAA